MDVYHKVLTRIFESADGKETVKVDMIDILKKEGFYSNIDNIAQHLQVEGWVTATERQHTVKLTHWGVAEAKRVLSDSPDKVNELEKESTRAINEARQLLIMLEEFAAAPSKDKMTNLEKQVSQINGRVGRMKSNL